MYSVPLQNQKLIRSFINYNYIEVKIRTLLKYWCSTTARVFFIFREESGKKKLITFKITSVHF